MSTAKRITKARKKAKLTIYALSKLSRVSTGHIHDLEHDKYVPSIKTLRKIAKALECALVDLID